MRVRAIEQFSVYWNYQVWPLAKGQIVDGGLAEYLTDAGVPVEAVEDEPAEPVKDAGDTGGADEVPIGPIAEVMDWVGTDPARARRALEVEQAAGENARTTLVASLQRIIDAA